MKKTDLRYVEKPDPKRPQLWMGDGGVFRVERFRILYPDGKTEWIGRYCLAEGYKWRDAPCWQGFKIIKSFKKRVRLMKEYDRGWGRKTMFLGNL